MLDNTVAEGITPFLSTHGKVQGESYILNANAYKSFQGSIVLGKGFVLEKEEAQALIAKDPRNKDILFPYLDAEDINSRSDQSPSRWVINFFDWPLEKAESYPDCMGIVREKVKSERDSNTYSRNAREKWWQYERGRLELYAATANMKRVLVIPRHTKYMVCAWQANVIVFSEATCVIASESAIDFTIVQSTIHDVWARKESSSLGATLRYTPTKCFETFPFPKSTEGLSEIGERYNAHRQFTMRKNQEGPTQTYNRFHDQQENDKDIVTLRELHREMDDAVAKAYGWDDLKLEHGFHETKQGLRYTISEAARREVLDRLLLLNHQRNEEEVNTGSFDGKASKGKGKSKGKDVVKEVGGSGRYRVEAGESEVEPIGSGDMEQGALF